MASNSEMQCSFQALYKDLKDVHTIFSLPTLQIDDIMLQYKTCTETLEHIASLQRSLEVERGRSNQIDDKGGSSDNGQRQ
jgi:hypothetical protein